MIQIHCPDHFAETMAFAINNGCGEILADKLRYLSTYGGDRLVCALHADFAPLSFGFSLADDHGRLRLAGGLIYSGPGQPLNGSPPALTVGIDIDTSKHGWSVHT